MRHPEKAENPIARLVMAQTVQNFVDNPYYLWKDGCSDTELENLKNYPMHDFSMHRDGHLDHSSVKPAVRKKKQSKV